MMVHALKKARQWFVATAFVALLGVGFSVEAVTNVTITSDIEDRGIGLYTNGTLGFAWINESTISVGDNNDLYNQSNTCTVLVFELPSLQSMAISNANLAVDVLMDYIDDDGPYPIGADLYGVRYDASPTVVIGDYGFNGSGPGTLLQEDVFGVTNYAPYAYSIQETDELGGGQLALWLTAQYDAGAVPGDYVFLRFEGKQTTTGPFKIASGDTALQTPPELTVVLGPEGYVPPPPPPEPPKPTNFVITSSTTDTFIGLDTNATPVIYWPGQNELSVGDDNYSSARGDQCAVLVYQLPDLDGTIITNAQLDISLLGQFLGATNYPVGIDLYGVRYDSSPTVLVSDYAPVGSNVGNGTLLQDDVASLSGDNDSTYAAFTPVSTSVSGNAALAAWVTAQYDAGAVPGDYVFLRFNNDKFTAGYWRIISADNAATNEISTLTLELEDPNAAGTQFIATESAGPGVLKLVFNTSSTLSGLSLVGRADLTGGSWGYVAHSDNSGGPFALNDLSVSTPEGTNYAIYVETTGTATFYGIE